MFMKKLTNKFVLLLVLLVFSGCSVSTKNAKYSQIENEAVEEISDEDKALKLFVEAKDLEKNDSNYSAISTYEKVWKFYPETSFAPLSYHNAGELYAKRRQYSNAFECFQNITKKYPKYPEYNKIIDRQFELARELQKGKRPYYFGIIPGFKDYDSAIEFFEAVIAQSPFSEKAPQALMHIAATANENGKKADAIDALDRLISKYPNHPSIPEAYLFKAEVYRALVRGPEYDQASTIKAIRCYNDLMYLFEGNDHFSKEQALRAEQGLREAKNLLAESKFIIGDFFYFRRNHFEAARTYYNASIELAPNSEIAKEAKERIQLLNDGVQPPKNWVDRLMGPYQYPVEISEEESSE